MVEAEEAVGVAGRRGAVVEAGQGQAVEGVLHLEGGEGAADGGQVEVGHLDRARVVEAAGLVLGDDA